MDESTELNEVATLPVADPVPELPVVTSNKVSLRARAVMLIAVITPFFGLIAAIISFWGWGFRWSRFGTASGNVCIVCTWHYGRLPSPFYASLL